MLAASYNCIFLAIKKQVRASLENSGSFLHCTKVNLHTVTRQFSYKVGVFFLLMPSETH